MSSASLRLNLHRDHFSTPTMAAKFYAIIAGVGSGTGTFPSLNAYLLELPLTYLQAGP
jgi:hypothetical protein